MTEQQPTTKLHTNYPPMPEPKHSRVVDGVPCITLCEHLSLMRVYVDADRAMRAHAAPAAAAVAEHELKDVRCECCGYMTYHREHTGCIRAAYTARAARNRTNHE